MALSPAPAPKPESALQRAQQFQRAARTTALEVADETLERLRDMHQELALVADLEGMPAGLRGEFAMLSTTIRQRLAAAEVLRSKL